MVTIRKFSDIVEKPRGSIFSQFVKIFKRVGDELVEEAEPYDTDAAIQQYADCALKCVLDRYLGIENVDLGSGYREPYVDPSELGEVLEASCDCKEAFGYPDEFSAGEIFKKISETKNNTEVKKGVEAQEVVPNGEQEAVQNVGSQDSQA